jgi:hypothetical protein
MPQGWIRKMEIKLHILTSALNTGLWAEYSCPSGTEVKNVWSYTSTSPYIFMALTTLPILPLSVGA